MQVSVHHNNINKMSFGQHQPKTVEITGKATKAKVYTENLDYKAYDQIKTICSHPVFKDAPVRIMPDTHASANTVVGFTAPVGPLNQVIPSIISGDIGCGMLCVNVDTKGKDIDFDKLDEIIRKYLSSSRTDTPSDSKRRSSEMTRRMDDLYRYKFKLNPDAAVSSIATLGRGNHFIELEKDENGEIFLTVHTGSRRFGQDVYNYHQNIALKQNPYKIKDLSYLSGPEAKDYLDDMNTAAKFSQINRRIIADEIIKRMGWSEKSSFESIHNYISSDGVIRKGAISSQKNERMVIPLNMRDGIVLARGKGNRDWNCSAPHGAGRQYSRGVATSKIALSEYKKAMQGIHSSCISQASIDEAPQAYKDSDEIIDNIQDTADIENVVKPIYNYKD